MLLRASGSRLKPAPSGLIRPTQPTNPLPALVTDTTASRSPAGDQAGIRLLPDARGWFGTAVLSPVRMVRLSRLARSKTTRLTRDESCSAKARCWLSADQAGL